jgi:membrane protein DedA with SNARE-associated domain
MEWAHQAVAWLVDTVHHLGYFGIFMMTFVESTFVPIPAEVTMIPAGYLVQQGKMAFIPVLLASIAGTVAGAYFNYWLAKKYGRDLFIRYGKYLMMTDAKLLKLERFFHSHGAISTFTGRLIPGIRHYISFPAGLARMEVRKFLGYTALGGAIWMTVLVTLGYFIGQNEALATKYLPRVKLVIILVLALAAYLYFRSAKRKAAREKAASEKPPTIH